MGKALRISTAGLGLLIIVGAVGGTAYYAGIEVAERQATTEVNEMMRLSKMLLAERRSNGRFPKPEIDTYETPKLTVSDISDSSVTYYSGVEKTRLLTLYLLDNGDLLVGRR